MSSKIVYIRRSPITLHEKSKEAADYFELASRSIGSYYPKSGGIRPATGVSLEVEDLLMPDILSISKEDRDYRAKCTAFFHAINTRIPAGDGVAFNIGLRDNTKAISKENLPDVPLDYLKYMHHKGHPEVADNEALGRASQLKKYFIFNPTAERATKKSDLDVKDKAMEAYLEVKKDFGKVVQYLTLFNQNLVKAKGEENLVLKKLAEERPADFVAIHNNKDKDIEFFIMELLGNKILTVVGSYINIAESNEPIGSTKNEAIAYFKDTKNSKQIAIFKQLLQSKQQAKIAS